MFAGVDKRVWCFAGLAAFQGLLNVPVPGLPAAAAVLQVLLFSLGVEMFQRGVVVQGEVTSRVSGPTSLEQAKEKPRKDAGVWVWQK